MGTTTTPRGAALLRLAQPHIGERYILGALAPKNNARWAGPWDCAEFVSWLVYQAAGTLYGCQKNSGNPASADAFTGFWARDARKLGIIISLEEAARTPGAAVLRVPKPGAIGHIVLSDGKGGTIEAHSTKRGVIASTLANRRWDIGVLVPGIEYTTRKADVTVPPPKNTVYRLLDTPMKGTVVRNIQAALKQFGFDPGKLDGVFGVQTHAAVVAFQVQQGLTADGEVGPITAKALRVILE